MLIADYVYMSSQKTLNQYALKYRPRTWDEVRGQEGTVKEMRKRSTTEVWPTVSLLQGPTGCGKTTVAFLQAAAMQCNHLDADGNPCGECEHCRDIFDENFDRGCTHMLDGASAGKDEVIATMRHATHSKPLYGKKHVFIVEEIDQMSPAAKKSLLKILEKPSPWIHFILLSMTGADGDKVPLSIADRALTYHFKSLKELDIAYAAKAVLEQEGVWATLPPEFKKEGFFTIVNNSGGSMRRALKLLNRAVFAEFFTTEEIEDNFLFLSESSALETLNALVSGDKATYVARVESMRVKRTIIEWLNLTNYLLLRYEENELAPGTDTSASTKLLSKLSSDIRQKVFLEVTNVTHKLRHGFTTPSVGARELIRMFNSIHTKITDIPVRG